MGFWAAITGRRRAVPPRLDALFAVPSAAITLEASLGATPTGSGSVCFKSAQGAAFAQTTEEILALVRHGAENPEVSLSQDGFGFTWLVVDGDPADSSDLCTRLHATNTTLVDQGFAEGLLCTLVPFRLPGGASFGLVYLYKQGTFYPFAPEPGHAASGGRRDSMLEFQVRDVLAAEGGLPLEADHSRWLALWGAPGL